VSADVRVTVLIADSSRADDAETACRALRQAAPYARIHAQTINPQREFAEDAAHRARGMINGLAYHFVIDNGTDGKPDGYIETGPRWINQMQGGHCRQAYINEHGIGICLVGNFSVDQPTSKQLDSLALLIHGLQEQFHIPDDHVLGHGEVIGEFSECPGSQFPWDELHKRLGAASVPSGSVGGTNAPPRNTQAHR